MKRLICTGKFSGELVVVYNDDHQLVMFDMQGAEMTPKMVHYFTQNVPVMADVAHFKKVFSTLTVVDEDYFVTFEMFWDRYGKKVNRERCLKDWDKLSKADRVKAFIGLNKYLRVVAPYGWREKADPENYLKKRYWENEWK